METAASFEARYAPSSHPTTWNAVHLRAGDAYPGAHLLTILLKRRDRVRTTLFRVLRGILLYKIAVIARYRRDRFTPQRLF